MLAGTLFFFVLGIVFWISRTTIVTDSEGIKKLAFNRVQAACRWGEVYRVETRKSYIDGRFITVLHWSAQHKSESNRTGLFSLHTPEGGMLVFSQDITHYHALLREIKEKAVDAELNDISEKLAQVMIENSQ